MTRLTLRTKLIVYMGSILLITLGVGTFLNVRSVKRDYLQAVEWRSEALAQNLVLEITDTFQYVSNVYDILKEENYRCVQLYEANKDKDLTHVGVIDSSERIASHSSRAEFGRKIESQLLLDAIRKQEQTTILDGEVYHTLVPIFGTQNNLYLGTVDVGFPKRAVTEKVRNIVINSVTLFGFALLFSFLTLSLLIHFVLTKPVMRLVGVGQQLAAGRLIQIPLSSQHDELTILTTAFNHISDYLSDIARVSTNIASGVLHDKIKPRSEQDVLGNAVQSMLSYLQGIAGVFSRIAEGDLTHATQIRSTSDAFGQMIHTMTKGIRSLILQIKASSEEIAKTGDTIASLSTRDIGIVEQIDVSAEQMSSTMYEMGGSIEQVAQSMTSLSSSVEETSASVSQMADSSESIATDATQLADQIRQSIEFLKEASITLDGIVDHTEVSKNLSQNTIQDALNGQKAVEQVMTEMETIHQTVTSAVESITRFAQRSQDIGSVLDVIREITDQTSLLALNASIIAAQAGSHGRGFAVVAEEIKSLAEGVGTSTKDIASIVNSLQEDSREVMQSIYAGAENVEHGMAQTQQARDALQKILSSAEGSSSVVSEIAQTLQNLLKNSRQIGVAMRRVSAMTNDITNATDEQQASSSQIKTAIAQVNEMTAQVHQATDAQLEGVRHALDMIAHITQLIEQNVASSQHITETTEELSSQAHILTQSVERFKLDTDDPDSDSLVPLTLDPPAPSQ